jgi:archaellum component FlaC
MNRLAVLIYVASALLSGCAAEDSQALSLFFFFAGLGLLFFAWACLKLSKVSRKLSKMVRSASDANSLLEVARTWREDPLLRGIFRDTDDIRELVTDRIDDLDLEWVMSRLGLSRVLAEQLPPAFTALGIFFTFVGLIQGIDNIDPTAGTEQLSAGMTSLLQGVSTAFYSSMFGIAFSVPALIIAKGLQQSIRKNAAQLRDIIVSQTERDRSPEGTLKSIDTWSHKNFDANTDIAYKMGTLGTDIKTAMESMLRDIVGNELKTLNSSMREFTEGSSQAHSAALDNVMTDFIEKFNESLGGQFEQLGETLKTTLEWHKTTQSTLQTVINDLNVLKSAQAEAMAIERELLEVRLASERRQNAQLDNLHARADQLTTQLQNVASSLDTTAQRWQPLGESIERSSTRLGDSVTSLDNRLNTLETLIGDFDNNLNASSEQLRNLARQIRSELEDGFSGTFTSFDKATAEVVDRLNASYVNLRAAVADLDETLKATRRAN